MVRRITGMLLAATALLPAAAMAQNDRGAQRAQVRDARQAARAEASANRADAVPRAGFDRSAGRGFDRARPPAAPRPDRRADGWQDFRQERRDDRQDFRRERRDDLAGFRQERREDRADPRAGRVTPPEFRNDRRDDRRDFRDDRRDDRQDFRRDRRDDRRDFARDRNWRDGGWGGSDWRQRNGWAGRDWNRGSWGGGGRWDNGWRRDPRYDWGGYRAQHRAAYRLPRYYAPYGWNYGYRRFSVGITLNSLLWGQNYWIGDPWAYRLPPAYGPYRWVRYYNDAILVDIGSGQVVDVIHDIFW